MKKFILGGIICVLLSSLMGISFALQADLKVEYPKQKLITYKDKILAKGSTGYSEIWINNLKMRPNKKGMFSTMLKLRTGGNHFIFKDKASKVERYVLKLPKYSDLPSKHFAKKQLEALSILSYFNKRGSKIYPKKLITRGEMARVLAKVAGLNVPGVNSRSEKLFPDVNYKTSYASFIYAVAKKKLMTGEANGKFYPNNKITKEEAVVLLVRAAKFNVPEKVSSLPFRDVSKTSWAAPFLKAAVDNNLIKARNKLNAKNKVTRGELALMLSRLPGVKEQMRVLETGRKG